MELFSFIVIFEKTRLKALAERYPDYEQPITEIIERFFDLASSEESFLPPFYEGISSEEKFSWLSHPSSNYADLDVQDGSR